MKSNNIEQKGNIIRNINWEKDVHKARRRFSAPSREGRATLSRV